MAYVGQGIKGGTFSVLDTSGNTYNGSNVTFDLGTQVGSPAQLLVSHDGVIQKPVTDYILASGGTQITFTTAPASGASIFITEISGAVGAPMNRDINGDELILDADADTSITADTDDQIDIRIAGNDDFKLTAKTLSIGGAAAADSKIVFDGNAQDYHIGLDDSADDLVIGLGSTLGTTSHIVIDEAGHVTKPLQPAFMANKSASGQTPSASTAVTVVFENEVFDNNADYNTTNSTFTAPVTGRYWFHTRIRTDEVGGGTGIYSIRLVASNRTIHNTQVDLSDYLDGTMNRMSFEVSGLLDMDASDTCKVQVFEDSGYEIEDEVEETFFMGYLVC